MKLNAAFAASAVQYVQFAQFFQSKKSCGSKSKMVKEEYSWSGYLKIVVKCYFKNHKVQLEEVEK